MSRKYNFCPGPATLPEAVLEQARDELLDWHGKGLSVMEMSHRSPEFTEVAQGAESCLRELVDIPDDYAVLFLQGGASGQFAAVPLNLGAAGKADYIDTGHWSSKAIAEGGRYLSVNVAASGKADAYAVIPPPGRMAAGRRGRLPPLRAERDHRRRGVLLGAAGPGAAGGGHVLHHSLPPH